MGFNSHIPLILLSLSKLSLQKINLKTTKYPGFPPQLHHKFLQNVLYNPRTPQHNNISCFKHVHKVHTTTIPKFTRDRNFPPNHKCQRANIYVIYSQKSSNKKNLWTSFLGISYLLSTFNTLLVHSLSFYLYITNFKYFPKVSPLSSSTHCYHPCSLHPLLANQMQGM